MSVQQPKLTYWDIPGRAEVSRLLFTLGKLDFEDKRIAWDDWPALRDDSPFGQVPLLELGGVKYAQSMAINQYLAKLVGLMPSDPLAAALADQAVGFIEDIAKVVAPTHLMPLEQATKARQDLLAGPLGEKLVLLNRLVETRPGEYIAGDELSHGDLAVFNHLGTLKSGLWTGIPRNVLDSYPALKTFRHQIASIPQIAEYYARTSDGPRRNGYLPDP